MQISVQKTVNKIFPLPIKINPSIISATLKMGKMCDPRLLLSKCDMTHGDFSRCVSLIRKGNIWKTTSQYRHSESDIILQKNALKISNPIILDIGVSDGSTSWKIIKKLDLNFQRYYATDLFLDIFASQENNICYFYNPADLQCFMQISDFFILYRQYGKSTGFLETIINNKLSEAPIFNSANCVRLSLCQPEFMDMVSKDFRIKLFEYDVLNKWPFERVDIIKIANVLNFGYFNEKQIKLALENIKDALKLGGKLLVVENRVIEKFALYENNKDGLELIDRSGDGVNINQIIVNEMGR